MADTLLLSSDDVLAPFEARPVTLSAEQIEARKRDLALGWELSRLQGATMTEAWERLLGLYARGQLDRLEYRRAGLMLAKSGALT